MKRQVIILDWHGTLSILPDPKEYIRQLRLTFPKCILVLNSGAMDLPVEVTSLFNCYYNKAPEREILSHLIKEKNGYIKAAESIPISHLEKVVVIDDQANKILIKASLSRFLGESIEFEVYNSVQEFRF